MFKMTKKKKTLRPRQSRIFLVIGKLIWFLEDMIFLFSDSFFFWTGTAVSVSNGTFTWGIDSEPILKKCVFFFYCSFCQPASHNIGPLILVDLDFCFMLLDYSFRFWSKEIQSTMEDLICAEMTHKMTNNNNTFTD